jgi:hypothetical protein
VARDARHQQRLGVSIEKGRRLGTSFDSGKHAGFCCACSKCIPHVEAANHASETSNKCGALLQVILLTRSSTSLISQALPCPPPCSFLIVFTSIVKQSRFLASRFAGASFPVLVYLQSRSRFCHFTLPLCPFRASPHSSQSHSVIQPPKPTKTSIPPFQNSMYWWNQRKVHPDTNRPWPALALSNFPPALEFDVDDIISSYGQNSQKDLEKAVVQCAASHDSFSSDALTLAAITSHDSPSLPPKRYSRVLRHLRLTIFTVYRRVFAVIFITNSIGFFLLLFRKPRTQSINLDALSTWASTNFLVSILVRQDFFVNLIFRTAWLVPWSMPLRIRRLVTRVYTYGGIHSGAAVAGTIWFLAFTILTTIRFTQQGWYRVSRLVLTWLILVLLVIILLSAVPTLRAKFHNTFEMAHRFLGWASVVLFWVQLFLLTYHSSQSSMTATTFGTLLVCSPTFWNLSAMTAALIYPWLRLRRWTFTPEVLSSHALRLHFSHHIHRFSCLSISTSPLREWHPFATFPSQDPEYPGGSMVISSAGDWTKSLIESQIHAQQKQVRKQTLNYLDRPSPAPTLIIWTRGTVKAGVLSLSCIFPRVIIVTTGSGIGPALSSLLDKPLGQFCRLIWSTRSPLLTYGAKLVKEVEKADPDAILIDTSEMGRPDLVEVVWHTWKETRAEAVFVLSNELVTRKVVYGLESRGVPAFGPIWDS